MSEKKSCNLCGDNVRRIRLARGLSLVDLEVILKIEYGVSIDRTNLGRLENGSRTISDIELVILAQVLDVSIDQLFPRDMGEAITVWREQPTDRDTRKPLRQMTPQEKRTWAKTTRVELESYCAYAQGWMQRRSDQSKHNYHDRRFKAFQRLAFDLITALGEIQEDTTGK